MTSSLQGIIIALLIAFLVGILVGYSFMQARTRKQAEALKVSQRRLAEIEQSHELRLREATDTLRRDYEAEIAETIEHYQDQLSQTIIEMEQIYETRFRVLQQGDLPTQPVGRTRFMDEPSAMAEASPVSPPRGTIEPLERAEPSLTQPELLHLKKQYELRLKEAAQKLQTAYEKQLADHARKTRADIQTEYEKRLVKKFEDYEQRFADRQAQLEEEYANRLSDVSMMSPGVDVPTPSQIMGTGDDTTVTMPPEAYPGAMAMRSSVTEYTQEQIEELVQAETERVQQEYEERLARQLEEQQEQFDLRLQDMEAEYKQKLAELAAALKVAEANSSAASSSSDDDLFGLGDVEDDDDDFGPLDLSDISQLT